MWFLLCNLLFAVPTEHTVNDSIVVTDSIYDEIYIDEPIVISEEDTPYESDTTILFVYMNSLHKSAYRKGKISAVYNKDTIGFVSECNYRANAISCGMEDGLWILKTVIKQTDEQATLTLLLYDEVGGVISQSSRSKKKITKVIKRQKTTVSQQPGTPMQVSAGNCQGQTCNYGSYSGVRDNPPVTVTEDLEPTIIEIKPEITDFDFHQAIMALYLSI